MVDRIRVGSRILAKGLEVRLHPRIVEAEKVAEDVTRGVVVSFNAAGEVTLDRHVHGFRYWNATDLWAAGDKSLLEALPYEFRDFTDLPAWKRRHERVVRAFDGCRHDPGDSPAMGCDGFCPWPGTHRHVYQWYQLESGCGVGCNENPMVGWTFPVVGKEVTDRSVLKHAEIRHDVSHLSSPALELIEVAELAGEYNKIAQLDPTIKESLDRVIELAIKAASLR